MLCTLTNVNENSISQTGFLCHGSTAVKCLPSLLKVISSRFSLQKS